MSHLQLLLLGLFSTGQQLAPAAPGSGGSGLSSSKPNVLVIVADDIGWRDIDPSVPTPHLDTLARNGVSFRRAYSMPFCSPTRCSIVFGIQPFREQLGTYIDPNLPGEVGIPLTRTSLAQVLGPAGYRTLAAGKWHLSTLAIGQPAAWEWPRMFGFEAFRAGRIGNVGGTVTYFDWPRIDDGVQTQSSEYNTSAIRRAAVDWWNAQSGPRLAYVAFHAAHTPYHVPPASLLPPGATVASGNRSRFEAMVTAMDTEIGNLLAQIDLTGTYVFFVGDNGTPVDAIAPDQDWQHVKGSVYEGGINVPLMVAGPGIPRGMKSDALISTTDLFATIAELARVPVPPGVAQDSLSFVAQLVSPGSRGRRWVYSQEFTPNGSAPKVANQRAVVSQRYKMITDGTSEYLFDLSVDPREQSPLDIATHPRLYLAGRALLDSMIAQGAP